MFGMKQTLYPLRLKNILVYCISSNFLLASNILPVEALTIYQQAAELKVAQLKVAQLSIEDPKVKDGIEKIPVPQQTQPKPPKQQINSPLPRRTREIPPANTINSPSNIPDNTNSPPRKPEERPDNNNPPVRNQEERPNTNNRPSNTNPRPSNQPPKKPIQQRPAKKPSPTNNPSNSNPQSPVNVPSKVPNYREIDFVDIPFGILSKKDYRFQGRYFHFYKFEGRENQVIEIRLLGSNDRRRTNNLNLKPYMFLLDPDNDVVLQRGSSGKSMEAFAYARLPATGTYTIAVTSQNPGDIGRYTLALRNDRASYAVDESNKLSELSPSLSQNRNPYNVTKFQGRRGQLVSIRVDSIFEEFSPYIVLLDSNGRVVSSEIAKDGKYSALIDRTKLPDDGTYYVVVVSSNPQERGRYRVTVF
ncbi:MAG: pre-peptidase C-terminal domain-containing protein [Scytonematopsis contorta HA4267-MV1]|jgi:hypothetical protein|nr:pre-peptidase C-terminal domain-containing protein [Scytonematopsis contorta HA4267-MV1]